jgi:hypothetical protein
MTRRVIPDRGGALNLDAFCPELLDISEALSL